MNVLTVLADDITGAAEIAGVCLRYGLSVTFDFECNIQRLPPTDVWIIASDTRSLPEKEACNAVRNIALQLKSLQVKMVFKKIDSALRGHILPEIEALCEYIPAEKVFILPANPETGRTIKDGIYCINGLPLHQTAFADDPDFPAQTSVVREILRLTKNDAGIDIITPDILHQDDYRKYAQNLTPDTSNSNGVSIDEVNGAALNEVNGVALNEVNGVALNEVKPETIAVGGSVFFEACLPVFFPSAKPNFTTLKPISKGSSILMICGSTHEASKQFIRENQTFERLEITSGFVEELLKEPENFRIWMVDAVFIFKQHQKLIIAVNNKNGRVVSSEKVKELLAKITVELINRCTVDELFIEGGATARACLQAAGFTSLIAVQEYVRGVVRFKITGRKNMYLTMKPGSYEWPVALF